MADRVVADTGLEVVTAAPRPRRREGIVTTVVRFCKKKPLGAAGGVLMLLMLAAAVLAEALATHDPIATDAANTLARPNADHWLGSDHLGRDVYSRIIHGSRVSLIVGVMSTLLGSVLGGVIGLLSAYFGGKTDLITQRIMDILQGLPLLVLALVMSAALGPAVHNVIIAISIPIIPRAARVIRALAAMRGDPHKAAEYAMRVFQDEVVAKALSSSDSTAGGFLLRCSQHLLNHLAVGNQRFYPLSGLDPQDLPAGRRLGEVEELNLVPILEHVLDAQFDLALATKFLPLRLFGDVHHLGRDLLVATEKGRLNSFFQRSGRSSLVVIPFRPLGYIHGLNNANLAPHRQIFAFIERHSSSSQRNPNRRSVMRNLVVERMGVPGTARAGAHASRPS